MKFTKKNIFAEANAALRHKDYLSAIALYEDLLRYAEEPLKGQFTFNRDWALRSAFIRELNDHLNGYPIKAAHQILRNPADPTLWKSLGADPNLLLDATDIFTQEKKWYRCSVQISTRKKKGLAKLYFDFGGGFNETHTVCIPFESGLLASRVFMLEELPAGLRFDPMEEKAEFQQQSFVIEELTETDARDTMLHRLIEMDKAQSKNSAWKTIQKEAAACETTPLVHLYERYSTTFATQSKQHIDYQEWIDTVETPSLPTQEEIRSFLTRVSNLPLISVVIPVYNTDEIYLKACIESVLAQSYPNWELCIADDNSPKPHVRRVLQEYSKRDQRIHVVYRKENGHISHASNSALQIAKGDFVALLDHDDELPLHALYFMAQAIVANPHGQVFYSDEDKINTKGERFSPHFKSDWNPDLFFSQNYVSHLGVYKRELLNQIKGFRAGLEGSQDQDLLLRCLPHVRHDQIIHIPRVLYHWRTVEGSTALASGEKSYTTEAGIKALRDYFAAHGPQGVQIEAGLVPNTYRTTWPVPVSPPLVSLLIPTRDKKEITEVAVKSILDKTTYPNYEIIILDNGSIETETLDWFALIQKQDARVRVIRYDHPFNYSAINNFGVRHAKGSLIGLINNDVEVINSEWLTEMVGHACRNEIGCVGAKLYYDNDTIQHAGVILGIGGVANHSHLKFHRTHPGYFARLICVQNYSAVTAACLVIRREVYEAVGGLEELNLKVAFNDVDLCMKVREAGYRNLWTPYAELYHHESISRGHEDTPEKQARFAKEVEYMKAKWGEALKQDAYYSPNLTKDREDFSLSGES